jgi:hypothetical protein
MSRILNRTVSVTHNDLTWTFTRLSALEHPQMAMDISSVELDASKEFEDANLKLTSVMLAQTKYIVPFLASRVKGCTPAIVDETGNPISPADALGMLDFVEVLQIFGHYTKAHQPTEVEKKTS